MKIQILVDNKKSWILNYLSSLINEIKILGNKVNMIYEEKEIVKGDVLIMLSCEKIIKSLNLNRHNVVVHESELPKGKGFSPLTWQILEGKNQIPITIFEASNEVDSGEIYYKDTIFCDGTELIEELREKQFAATKRLIIKFLKNLDKLPKLKNSTKESFYKKRTPEDSMLDVNKTIVDQFNLLRVVDNKRYPAFFILKGVKYKIEITKWS